LPELAWSIPAGAGGYPEGRVAVEQVGDSNHQYQGSELRFVVVPGGLGPAHDTGVDAGAAAVDLGGQPVTVMAFTVADGAITMIRSLTDPDRLAQVVPSWVA
jgi:hypothetical protein